MTAFDLDELCDRFETQWCEEQSGADGVVDFMSQNQLEPEDNVEALAMLGAMDIERAWMAWNAWLPRNVTASSTDILSRFQGLPSFFDYHTRWAQLETLCWRSVAECELKARDRWGDAIGAFYYRSLFGYPLDLIPNERGRTLTIDFRNPESCPPSDPFTVRGRMTLGRQRSGDNGPFICECLPEGNRITIATQVETTISRTHLTIQLVHPDYALVTNTCRPDFPSSLMVYGRTLVPGRPQLAKFPFSIGLPDRKLILR